MKTLAFDAESILAHGHSGVGWSAINLMRAVAQLNEDDRLRLQYFIPRRDYDKPTIDSLERMGYSVKTSNFHGTLYKMVWRFMPLSYSRFFGEADATCFFNFHLPPGVKGKKVVFVHDMAFKEFPETVRWKTKYMLQLNMGYTIRHADKIIAVSEFTKSEIQKYYDVSADRIEVVYNAVDTQCFHTDYTSSQVQQARQRYGIPPRYFLYLGTLEPRKNIENMLRAYHALQARGGDIPKFVIAGSKGWLYESIFQLTQQLGLEDSVIFTGYVQQQDAPLLMKGALAFLFVSLYEGFGMPPLEAMACGTPVIASNTAALPEATGGRVTLVDPYSVENIAMAMQDILEQPQRRDRLIRDGLEWVKNFSWQKSGQKLLDIMRDI